MQDERDDLSHYAMIPWISFSSFAHARKPGKEDSVSKIVCGKYIQQNDRIKMPVSVEVQHSLIAGPMLENSLRNSLKLHEIAK